MRHVNHYPEPVERFTVKSLMETLWTLAVLLTTFTVYSLIPVRKHGE